MFCSYEDRLRFGLWLSEYCLTFLAFIIGLICAPAVATGSTERSADSEDEPLVSACLPLIR